jgi:hypothetical protein
MGTLLTSLYSSLKIREDERELPVRQGEVPPKNSEERKNFLLAKAGF